MKILYLTLAMDFTHISFLTGLGCGLCVGLSFYTLHKLVRKRDNDTFTIPDVPNFTMVLVVRTDISMGKGKIAAQCGHAAVGAVAKAQKNDKESLEAYRKDGQIKIALKIDSEKGLLNIANSAKKIGLITSVIRDAGRTQISPNTITVVAIGPGPKDVINQITGHLQVL